MKFLNDKTAGCTLVIMTPIEVLKLATWKKNHSDKLNHRSFFFKSQELIEKCIHYQIKNKIYAVVQLKN